MNKEAIQNSPRRFNIPTHFLRSRFIMFAIALSAFLFLSNTAIAKPFKPLHLGEKKPISFFPFTKDGSGRGGCTLCDLDANGHIAPYDQSRLMEILLGSEPTPQELCAGDLNPDGVINGLDIQNWVNVCRLECTAETQQTACDDQHLCTTDTCDNIQGCQHQTVTCPPGQSCAPETGMCVEDFVIAHFNWGPPNQVGGNWGPWSPELGGCALLLDDDALGVPNAFSQATEYDLSFPDRPFCGMWMQLGPQGTALDASSYKTISFYAKGDATVGFTDKFIVELKDANQAYPYLVQGVTDLWKRYDIPLLAFAGGIRASAFTEFTTAFSHDYSQPQHGKISIDQITFSRRVSDLLIADFQIDWPDGYGTSASNTNNLLRQFGAWDGFPQDPTQRCTEQNDGPDALGNPNGHSLRIDYDVDSPNPAWCGFWMQAEVDPRDYGYIKFYVKSDGPIVDSVRVELKRFPYDSGYPRYIINGISNEWREIAIPLDYFHPFPLFEQLYQFVVVFENGISPDYEDVTPRQGRIYIDHVRLTER